MFGITEAEVFQWFADKAYQPELVYFGIVFLMFASSFGLPLPEEVPLVSAGLVGHVALHPHLYPRSEYGGEPVNIYTLAAVSFCAVFFSDLLIFFIGKFLGKKLLVRPRFAALRNSKNFLKVEALTKQYGALASGIFRFTPGLRFPGHMTCGMMGVPTWKFIAVDGTAALLTVPTQILLVGYYGDVILQNFKIFKFILLGVLAMLLILALIKKLPQWRARKQSKV
jgi:membrane protein DedA with SNARE-associated domain